MDTIIITPVRNEEKYVKNTIECMLKQTKQPKKWIIVNDGSTDNTENIILESILKCHFIKYIRLDDRGYRKPGQGVVETFNVGLASLQNESYDVIAKFDADIEFPIEMIEKIEMAFKNDIKLGITGPTEWMQHVKSGTYKQVIVPKNFVGGPHKFYRRECYEAIGGLIKRAGWDGVDTIKANMAGWKTMELKNVQVYHLKSAGSSGGEGIRKACEKYGDVSYYMGGYFWYFILRVIGRSIESKDIMVGYYMILGYINSHKNKLDREGLEFRNFLKNQQIENIKYYIGIFFNKVWRKSRVSA